MGRYTLTFQKDGFAPVVQQDVSVGVQSALRLDATLQIGGLKDGITVTADPETLDSRSGATGTTLQNAVVTNLPLNITSGRSIENFAYAIAPGVEGNNWTSNIVGGAPFSKEVILEGTSATIQIQGHITESSPPMEAVQEFKVDTSGMPAEYGRTGGGIFNFSLRSGTNTLHGSAYGQLRHEAFDANTWMNEYLLETDPARSDQYAKPRDRQQLGGVSLGGPIASSRTFYFAAFEEYQQTRHQLGPLDRTVPTAAFLDGDFSALLDTSTRLGTDAAGAAIYRGAIFDPRTGLVFPGNMIPANRISPISRKIAAIYRQSYQPMAANRIINNSAGPAYVDPSFTQHQFSVKADHVLTADARLSGSLIWTKRPRTLVDQGGVWDPSDDMGGPLAKSRKHEVTSYQVRLNHSQVLSPSLLHVGTVTFNRFRNPSTTASSAGDWPATARTERARRVRQLPADQLRRRDQRRRYDGHRLRDQQLLRHQRVSVQRGGELGPRPAPDEIRRRGTLHPDEQPWRPSVPGLHLQSETNRNPERAARQSGRVRLRELPAGRSRVGVTTCAERPVRTEELRGALLAG